MTDETRRRLREAAASHQPDRARMLARVERGMAGGAQPAGGRAPAYRAARLRVAGATAAVVTVLAFCGYAAATLTRPGGESAAVASPPPPPSSSASERPPTGGQDGSPGDSDGDADGHGEDGGLWAGGSVDPHSNSYWAQSNVTLKNRRTLTSLTVELRIAGTGGVASTGNWRTRPAADFDFSVREEGGALVHRWVLREGRTVPPGQHVFAGQYNHAEGGRDTGGDSYTIRTDVAGEQRTVSGDFAPARR